MRPLRVTQADSSSSAQPIHPPGRWKPAWMSTARKASVPR